MSDSLAPCCVPDGVWHVVRTGELLSVQVGANATSVPVESVVLAVTSWVVNVGRHLGRLHGADVAAGRGAREAALVGRRAVRRVAPPIAGLPLPGA